MIRLHANLLYSLAGIGAGSTVTYFLCRRQDAERYPFERYWPWIYAESNVPMTHPANLLPSSSPDSFINVGKNRASEIMRCGFPGLENVQYRSDYVLSYNPERRGAKWVAEHINVARLGLDRSLVSRRKCDFHEDKSAHEYFRSQNADYKSSGFDRGHLAAAGNHWVSQESLNETFLLSNIAPQVGEGFNRDKWNELEKYCRKLTKHFANVYIFTGPLFLPKVDAADGKMYVKYQVIGQNNVAVPTHFYKVVFCEDTSGMLSVESFVLPNIPMPVVTPLDAFHVPIDTIERASGLLFIDKIPRTKLKALNKFMGFDNSRDYKLKQESGRAAIAA